LRIRFHYSLLTLLVLTALVAGGTKFWFGPRSVVEQTSANIEEEYTFTRDWHGTLTLHGPFIRRIFKPDTRTLQSVTIDFYRSGLKREWAYAFFSELDEMAISVWPPDFSAQPELTAEEQNAWKSAIELEREELIAQGYRHNGMWMRSWLAENLKGS
jgi:hypothetical protein